MPSVSESLARFAADLHPADLPAPVVARVKRHLLDLLGVALAAAGEPFAARAREAVAALAGATGTATVIGAATRLPPAWAALVNGVLAHGLDFDDTHEEAVTHVSCSVAPTMLAAAECHGGDGAAALTALALGMESAVRIGLVARGAFHDRGFHPTGVCGAYAASLVAGRLAGLDAARLAHALGLAGSMAAGTMEFLTDGSWAKRVHAGWAAHAGVTATALAAAGFSGPRATLEGRFGLYRSHLGAGEWDVDGVTRDLGRRWHLLDIALKPYPCCHMTHAFIDAAAALRGGRGGSPAPLVADDLEAIECHIHPREMPVVCEPVAHKQTPQTDYDAKFSLPYTVASMFVRGHVDLDDFTPAAIADRAVLGLARRVTCLPDPAADYPRCFPGRLRVRLRDGRVFEHDEPVNRGSFLRPLGDADVGDKFRRNAARVLAPAQVDAVADAVERLDRAADLSALAAALRVDE
ncbi:MAG TPA: MmgE/PrpD family protein [Candidatus Dormibacteraeota bacterium]|nr:MmgE/PrpD family protein [Candidatus Dormibacteraeota bacterium]